MHINRSLCIFNIMLCGEEKLTNKNVEVVAFKLLTDNINVINCIVWKSTTK